MYHINTILLKKKYWMLLNQVALDTDGCSSITRHRTRLAARMHANVS